MGLQRGSAASTEQTSDASEHSVNRHHNQLTTSLCSQRETIPHQYGISEIIGLIDMTDLSLKLPVQLREQSSVRFSPLL